MSTRVISWETNLKTFMGLLVGKVKGKPNFKLSMLDYASNVNDILLDFMLMR